MSAWLALFAFPLNLALGAGCVALLLACIGYAADRKT